MDDPKLKKRLKKLVLLLIGLLIIGIVFIIYSDLTFHITGTDPNLDNVTVISPFINIYFNKKIEKDIQISSSTNIISSYSVGSKSIHVNLTTPLLPNQKYTINITSVYAVSKQSIKDKALVFEPKSVKGALPANQNQAVLNQQTQYSNSIEDNGLLQLLPFTGPNFEYQISYNVNYQTNPPLPIIQIETDTPQGKQDALSWISGQGYDPTKLDIQYVNGQP